MKFKHPHMHIFYKRYGKLNFKCLKNYLLYKSVI